MHIRYSMVLVPMALIAALAAACGDKSQAAPQEGVPCVANATEHCACVGHKDDVGVQTCKDGAWGACTCPGGTTGAGGSTSTTVTSGPTTTSSTVTSGATTTSSSSSSSSTTGGGETQVVYLVSGIPSNAAPSLMNVKTSVKTAMAWSATYNAFALQLGVGIAPTEYWIEAPYVINWAYCPSGPTCYDSSYFDSVCHEAGTVTIKNVSNGNANVAVTLSKVSGQNTCHRYTTLPN